MPLIQDLRRSFDRRTETLLLNATCEIRDPDTIGALNEADLDYDITNGTVIYTGSCAIQSKLSGRENDEAALSLAVDESVLKVPSEASGFEPDQVVEILTCPEDADLVGVQYEVVHVPQRSTSALRTLIVRRHTVESAQRQVPSP